MKLFTLVGAIILFYLNNAHATNSDIFFKIQNRVLSKIIDLQ